MQKEKRGLSTEAVLTTQTGVHLLVHCTHRGIWSFYCQPGKGIEYSQSRHIFQVLSITFWTFHIALKIGIMTVISILVGHRVDRSGGVVRIRVWCVDVAVLAQ